MIWRTRSLALALVFVAGAAQADEPAASPGASVELRFVLTRHEGGIEVGRSTHALRLTAGDAAARLSAGIQMPVWTRANDTNTVVFKDVGTYVACKARALKDARFQLPCEIGQYAPFSGKPGWGASSAEERGFPLGERPEIRAFSATSSLVLGDGETARWASATDPVTGERIVVEAALTVLSGDRSGAEAADPPESLELDVQIERRAGSRPTGSARYILRMTAADVGAELKAGVMSPVRSPNGLTNFKDQVTRISCEPRALGGERYRLSCEFEQDLPYSGGDDWAAMGAAVESFSLGNAHVARTLRASAVLYLNRGEATEWLVGTDPVSGETVGLRLALKSAD